MEENKTDIFEDEDAIGALPEDESAEDGDIAAEGEALSDEEARRAERAEYDRLIRSRFKDFYTEDTQRMINRRFRKYKELEEKLKAAEEERSAKEAERSKKLTRDALLASIRESSKELKREFDDFSEELALSSEKFLEVAEALLECGRFSLSDAYKLSNFDEIVGRAVEDAARATEERVLGEIRSKRARPTENGLSRRSGAAPFDVSRLTRDERARLAKRAARGERIKF